MLKQQKYNIQDTNIALLGSDIEKNVRKNAAGKEEAWKVAGKVPGIEIWRIEQFKIVPWPKERFGEFFSGDSYIVLHTYKKEPTKPALAWDVHFWLGKETTQDEAGTAAYKTVELDDFLGGAPVQHREVQGHESETFLSYFPKLSIMDGGIASGFKQVKPEEYRKRLLHIKGNKNKIVVREVDLSHQSLNSGDVFVFDGGLVLYQWNGANASGHEKHKALELCKAISDERKGLAKHTVFNEGDADLAPFWEAIGGQGPIKSATEGGDDKAAAAGTVKKLFRLSDSSGKMEFKEEASGKVQKKMFDTNDVFVFDSGCEVYVWIGKGSTQEERRRGLQYAQDYLTKYNRPAFLPISRILEGGENETFNASLDPEDPKVIIRKKADAPKDSAGAPTMQANH